MVITMDTLDIKLTDFGRNLSFDSGVVQLIDNLALFSKEGGRHLAGGQPPFPNPISDIVKEGEREVSDKYSHKQLHSYGDPQGFPPLRQAIANEYHRVYDWPIDPDKHVIVMASSSFANFAIINSLAGQDCGNMLYSTTFLPQYIGYGGQFISGVERTLISLYQEIEEKSDNRFRFKPNFDLLKKTLQIPNVNLVIHSRENNPTTQVLQDDLFEEFVDTTSSSRKWLLLDEAYGNPHPGLIYTKDKCEPVFREGVIMSKTLSKDCLSGDRVSYVICKDERIIRILRKLNTHIMFQPSTFSQALVEVLMTSGKIYDIGKTLREHLQKNEKIAVDTFRKECDSMGNVLLHLYESAFYGFYFLRNLPEDKTAADVENAMAKIKVPIVNGKHSFYGSHVFSHQNLSYDPRVMSESTFRVCYSGNPEKPQDLVLSMTDLAHAVDSAGYGMKK